MENLQSNTRGKPFSPLSTTSPTSKPGYRFINCTFRFRTLKDLNILTCCSLFLKGGPSKADHLDPNRGGNWGHTDEGELVKQKWTATFILVACEHKNEILVANYVIQVAKLDSAIKSNDPKILQMELQGSIGTTVNQVEWILHSTFLETWSALSLPGPYWDSKSVPTGAVWGQSA